MRPTRSLLRVVASALILVVVVVAFPGVGAAAGASPDPDAPAPVAPELEFKAATEGDVAVIAVTDRPGAQVVDAVTASLPEGSASDIQPGVADHVALTVDAEGLEALAEAPHVERIVENRANRVVGDAWLGTIGQPAAASAGWDGTGRTIAILDTGVQVDHPYLAGKVVAEACFSGASGATSLCPGGARSVTDQPGAAGPCTGMEGCEHGTHVAGIAVGGPVSSPAALNGVAPAARLIAVKVFSKVTNRDICGSLGPCLVAYDSDVADALAWINNLRASGDPLVSTLDVVNLSLGGGAYAGTCDASNPVLTPAVNALVGRGVATVVATGNNGLNGSVAPARMSSPACISTTISVGSTTGSGQVSSFSNLTAGTTILAPGSGIRSSVPGSGYGTLSGTSMAAPAVAASFADLRQRNPGLTVKDGKALLTSTGDRIPTSVGVVPELQLDNALADVPGRPTFAPGPPFGSIDAVSGGISSLRAAGWAIDPDTALPIAVHVYVDGVGVAILADGERPDVHAAFGYGPRHGYTWTGAAAPGPHQVCLYGINAGAGGNVLLGCRTVTVASGPPIGSLDVVATGPGSVSVAGWALDPDTAASIPVHVYVDGAGYAVTADGARSDIASVYPGYGAAHGFGTTVPAPPGRHTVCVYGINAGPGANSTIGCRVVVVPNGPPVGSLDLVRRNLDGSVSVGGWALDPDVTSSIAVHVYVGGQGFALTADGARPDVGAVYPGYGPSHGFSATVGLGTPPGTTVCAYGINVGLGGNSLLGCRTI